LRGLIIPVIDVKEKLGLGSEGTNSSKQRILVADVNGSLTGLLVDEVDQVMRIQTKDIEEAPQGAFESYHYLKGIAKINERLIILLDVGSLMGQKEAQKETKKEQTAPKPTQQQIPPTEKTDTQPTIDDIPAELAEVFKEDAEGIPPTQIQREN
ncbi:MAG TPA: chemotaxis protein CheW, partial [Candidatus Nitrosotenuis sp.]|nr:chemotaxis protein CheW [Candidatus Nitrosotenuis sp.]